MVSFALHGVGVSAGVAIGRAQLVSHATLEVAHYAISAKQTPAEIERFELAVKEVQRELETLHAAMTSGDVPGEFGAFLDVHWMILNDPTLSEAPKKIIAEQHCNAEWALTQQMGVLVEQFEQIEDSYLRERKNDVVQVGERVLKRLMGRPGTLPAAKAEEQTILVAHDLSPADVIQFKHHHYGAFLTDLGGVTSHTAIVARSLNVPAVVATHNARQLIRDGELLIVDGANHVVTTGVGLFRSEFLFLNRAGLPSEDEQFEAYRAVAEGMGRKPVTIRTFDLGADKHKEGLDGLARVAPNPALGLRAVRFCLAEPRLFLTQLRAILRASHYGDVQILVPMLASAGEIDQTLALLEQAKETLREQGVPFNSRVAVGGMIEIPAAVLAMDVFLKKLDFLSIGTNDLIQYTLAVDRADEAVSHLYDPLHPAVMRLLSLAIGTAKKAKVSIAVCGEMAGDPFLTRLLLGMGLTNFSMHPAHLLTVKQRVLQSDVSAAKMIVDRIRRADEPGKVLALIEKLNA